MNKTGLFAFCLIFWGLSGFGTGEIYAARSANDLREEVRGVIKMLSPPVKDSLLKEDSTAVQAAVDGFVSDVEKRGKPVTFGIGILDGEGLAIAGRYVIGTFKKGENFSNYNYVMKAFKQKKIISERLFFQDQSEILIVCIPLVQQKEVIGSLVLGFSPSEVKRDYGLTTEQFLTLKFD
jgi:hypothetical protein